MSPQTTQVSAEDEVVSLAQDLIRIDTTNTGEPDTTIGERKAAEFVATQLSDVGIEASLFESAPGRASVVARIAGTDPNREGLVLHGHIDVVPAVVSDWTHHPFGGEIVDGYLWGRGAVDMKNMDAMILAIVRDWARTGYRPTRDIVLAFFADEEAGSSLGSQWMVDQHPEVFEGCTEAVSEVGGFSVTLAPGKRLYPIQTAEKGIAWARLTASGRAGHGSMLNDANALTALAEAIIRIGRHEFPASLAPTVEQFLRVACEARGVAFDPHNPTEAARALGSLAPMVEATFRTTANPTMISGGYKANVIPAHAEATIDGRFMPGEEELLDTEVRRLAGPNVNAEWIVRAPAIEAPFGVPLTDTMVSALEEEDPGCFVAPYMISGGTDAKALSRLGIRGYGFSPLQLPPDFDFLAMFHGTNERVPVDALRFGVRVLDRFLRNA